MLDIIPRLDTYPLKTEKGGWLYAK